MSIKTTFLSSTARDLAQHRKAVYRAIEGLDGYHCVWMEDFGARDREAIDFCCERVAECDVFVGIVGHLYGSCPRGAEQSYTEMEYEAAVAADIPRLMFIAPEDFRLPANLREPDNKRRKQSAFRERVTQSRVIDTFTTPEDLARRVVQAIRNWEREPAKSKRARLNVKQVFISHSMEDAEFAHRLADDLGRHDISVWIAPESIRPGETWVDAINRGLSDSTHVVVMLTPAAVTSKWVRIEMSAAIDLERREEIQILPLDVQLCQVPPLWQTYQAISFSPRHYEAGLSRLLERFGCERQETPRAMPGYILDQVSIIVDQIQSLSPPYTPAQLSSLRHQMDEISGSLRQLERQTDSRAAKVRIRSLLGPVGSREAASCVNFQGKTRLLEDLLQRKYDAEYVAESLTQLQRLASAIAYEIEQILKLT